MGFPYRTWKETVWGFKTNKQSLEDVPRDSLLTWQENPRGNTLQDASQCFARTQRPVTGGYGLFTDQLQRLQQTEKQLIFRAHKKKTSRQRQLSASLTHPLTGCHSGRLLHMSLKILMTMMQDLRSVTLAWRNSFSADMRSISARPPSKHFCDEKTKICFFLKKKCFNYSNWKLQFLIYKCPSGPLIFAKFSLLCNCEIQWNYFANILWMPH